MGTFVQARLGKMTPINHSWRRRMGMRQEAFETSAANGGNPRIAPQNLPAARFSPVTVESGTADYGLSSSLLDLVSHVRMHGDRAARVEVEQYLGEVVL